MGAGQSKEELLYLEVQNGNYNAVKSLRRDGASLEWVDKEGRTPLILACTRGELLDMAITLLNLGANVNAYRPGSNGGSPLHHAAKRGLEKTVMLLLSRGADPLGINDDAQTPLDMARSRGHVSVVRLLEEQLNLFCGELREISGPGILETLAPTWVTKKIWAVVLPIESNPRRPPRYELVIYQSTKAPQPRTVIQLDKAEVEKPNIVLADPVLYITDTASKMKYKFLSGNQGDKGQLERLYKACKGIFQGETVPMNSQGLPFPAHPYGNPSQIHPIASQQGGAPSPNGQTVTASFTNISSPSNSGAPAAANTSEDLELTMAVHASIRSAAEEGILVSPNTQPSSRRNDLNGWGDVPEETYNGWGVPDSKKPAKKSSYGGWEEGEQRNTYNGWGPAKAGSSRSECSAEVQPIKSSGGLHPASSNQDSLSARLQPAAAIHASPSAPPLPFVPDVEGPIQYPSIDSFPVGTDYSANRQDKSPSSADNKADDKVSGMCVVCWDAPAQGACVPCGHLAGCMSCLSEIRAKNWGCPVCRASIENLVKVYAV